MALTTMARISAPHATTAPRRTATVRSLMGRLGPVAASLDRDAVLEQRARDDEALDFARAFVDLHDARVAVIALDRILLHVAVAAVDLDRLVRDPGRGLGRVQLGHRRRAAERLIRVAHPRRAADQQARTLHAPLH